MIKEGEYFSLFLLLSIKTIIHGYCPITYKLCFRCTRLKVLKLYRALHVPPQYLAEIPNNLPYLEVLSIYKCNVTDNVICQVVLLPSLRSLKILGSSAFTGSLARYERPFFSEYALFSVLFHPYPTPPP
jgi:hypothetical protein